MGSPVVHKAVRNLAGRKVELDIAPGAGHMVVGLDIGAETARIEAEAGYKVVDRVLTVVDIVVEDYYTDLILLAYTQAGRMDPCLLMYCHSRHKTAHALHSVFRNSRTALPQFVELPAHAHHDHTGYKT